MKDLPDSHTLGGPADNGEIRTCGVFLKQSREHEARDRHADDGDEDRQEIDPAPAVQSRQDTKDQSKDQTDCHGLQTQLQRSRETLGNNLVCGKAGSLIGLSHLAVKKILQINNILLSYRFIEAPTCL